MTEKLDIAAFRRQFSGALADGAKLGKAVEKGQAETPVTDLFEELNERADSGVFGLTLLATSAEVRDAVLAWSVGSEVSEVFRQLPESLQFVDIAFGTGAYSVERADRTHEIFKNANDLSRHLRKAMAAESVRDEQEISRVFCGNFGDVGNLRLMVVAPVDALQDTRLLARISALSGCLIFASPSSDLPAADLAAVRGLAATVELTIPVITGSVEGALPTSGWWADPKLTRACRVSAPIVLDPQDLPSVPPIIGNAADDRRQAIQILHLCRRLTMSADTVGQRIDIELRQLKGRRAREIRSAKVLANNIRPGTGARSGLDAIKSQFSGELTRLFTQLKESVRKAQLPTGELTLSVKEIIATIEASDVELSPGSVAVRLSVKQAFIDTVVERIRDVAQNLLNEDLEIVRKRLKVLEEQMRGEAYGFSDKAGAINLRTPDQREIWQAMEEMLAIELNYQGELPKRGFFKRLGEGRRQAFMVLMSLSLVGYVIGTNIRGIDVLMKLIGMLILAMFIGGFIRTYVAWKREDESRIEKEMHRIKTSLTSETNRLASDIQREKLARFQAHFDNLQSEAQRLLDSISNEFVTSQTEGMDKKKQKIGEKLQTVDKRVNELRACFDSVTALERKCREMSDNCWRALSINDFVRD